MNQIAFVDTEINPKSQQILDLGGIRNNGNTFHQNSPKGLAEFLQGVEFICGHNILKHDLKYLDKIISYAGINAADTIDTLFLSPLLFPERPYHRLLKDDKLQTEESNNPLNDAIKAKDLFNEEVSKFISLTDYLKQIYYSLLKDKIEFRAFFKYIAYPIENIDPEILIRVKLKGAICENVNLKNTIAQHSIELAYAIALINCNDRYSITPPWVLKHFPDVDAVMKLLRSKPCIQGCEYCHLQLNAQVGLKKFFGYDAYRTYDGQALQENAVKAAIDGKSLLAVFPTGGGKSITFQVPALMAGENSKGLTVVISPLQSLMKDQVDNLEKNHITEAVTINGLLDPIERSKSFERVQDGLASLLYISPESLRSNSIERLLLGRRIERFVIDEAHCFSSWGQDFRVDYLYIADFIKQLQVKKNLTEKIPVSCFTATAKQKVIEDICSYFKDHLDIELEVFSSSATRTNLRYKVYEKSDEEQKYNSLLDLIEEKNCPTIVYVSRTKRAAEVARKLNENGFNASAFHGKMDSKEKTNNQNAFIAGDVQIMVATSAFGMGVDKKDVGMVIHYEISDSLENYVQEAGRAGRDENIQADCFVLFNEEDLNKHFILLNQTRLSSKEIQQVWKAVKDLTKFRSKISNSALEIARKAGWDDDVQEIETRVTTAIAALEDAGYLKRGQNMPRIFASSILSKNAQEAIEKINSSHRFDEKQKQTATRIIKKLFSSKSRKNPADEEAEARIDYISDHLGVVKEEVINIVNLLREEKILEDHKDLTAFIKQGEYVNRTLNIVNNFNEIEKYLLTVFDDLERTYQLKELNEWAENNGLKNVTPNKLKTIINFWSIKNWIKSHHEPHSKNHISVVFAQPISQLKEKLNRRNELAKFISGVLFLKSRSKLSPDEQKKEEVLVEFSVHELKKEYEEKNKLLNIIVSIEDIEDALFYLSKIEAIKIEGGFLVVYNKLTLERLETNNTKRYTNENYQKLSQFYDNKVQQIHIVGEYAKKMINDYQDALKFVDDYFQLNYTSFVRKYFPGSKQDELKRNITPEKFQKLFGTLSTAQLNIIKDNESKNTVVAAGPGSGKTRLLVHKLASLLLMEDVKHEQLLMLTFSRAAATDFKKRLLKLIANVAHFIEIKTFHSYCFDLLGRVGSIHKSNEILKNTVLSIKNGEVEINKITKTVLVIDEAQDMNADEFELINALIDRNEDLRVIAVGDDDQNIFEFRGSEARNLQLFINERKATKHELTINYRSKRNLVEFSNGFVTSITQRLKETPITAQQQDLGKIKIVNYKNGNLITPLVNDILKTDLTGTTCVLTQNNHEAMQVNSLLLKSGMHSKLIQTNDGFNLFNLMEVRHFLQLLNLKDGVTVISEEVWEDAKRALVNKFQNNPKLEICKNIIRDFELINNKNKYKSSLEEFIKESKLESFYSRNSDTIFVSTIHKAKGNEFENVFILLDNFDLKTEEKKRLLYVALTRAKRNLTIHLNGAYLNHLTAENMERINDDKEYEQPNQIMIQLTLKDIWLDSAINQQYHVNLLSSADSLKTNEDACYDMNGHLIIKYSKQFKETIEKENKKGYSLKTARVNFILFWKKEDTENEIKIVLPEVIFERV